MNDHTIPQMDLQAHFWDTWNISHRTSLDTDDYMQAQLTTAQRLLPAGLTLDLGCGTGWLTKALNSPEHPVIGVDLSPEAIAVAHQRAPSQTFLAGDFLTLDLGRVFQNVVSLDCLSHVGDQQAFVDRVASLLHPGGTFLLMTQNPFVWSRTSYLMPQGHGQIRHWLTPAQLRALLVKDFTIDRFTAIVAGGNQGVLRVLNGRVLRGLVRLGIGKTLRDRLFDHYLGRELVIVARRR
jgi:2-polyprenyl-3-methyl-5-hydroxy-6-metoxy-1,4-benzoquinol methylase